MEYIVNICKRSASWVDLTKQSQGLGNECLLIQPRFRFSLLGGN